EPEVDKGKWTYCGICIKACPHTPSKLVFYARQTFRQGEKFGLGDDFSYYISYDNDLEARLKSSSGGALTAVLKHLLDSGEVKTVVASKPLMAPFGRPHYQIENFHTSSELEKSRSSHYHPLNYYPALKKATEAGTCAVVALPCIVRGLKNLPDRISKNIKYFLSPVCAHNVSGAFVDVLARLENIPKKKSYTANLRDKEGIADAGNYNNFFLWSDGSIRKNRFETGFTRMWRNYFFARECCLYCPDFFGAESSLSAKDGWGRLSKDPLGLSLLVVRDKNMDALINDMVEAGSLYAEACDEDEVLNSQKATAIFKHVDVHQRINWHSGIRDSLREEGTAGREIKRSLDKASLQHFKYLFFARASSLLYRRGGVRPVKLLLHTLTFFEKISHLLQIPFSIISRSARKVGLLTGIVKTQSPPSPTLRVLVSGGYGYGNVGDEAQLAANLQLWRKEEPACRLTVLSPRPEYTLSVHSIYDINVEAAPRDVFFFSNTKKYYGNSSWHFKLLYLLIVPLLLGNVALIRAGLPVFGISGRQARLLDVIRNSDVLFLSGGGYLTGRTLSRLWDNMLMVRIAAGFGVPVIMSGQTIGLFNDKISRILANLGFNKAELIYTRDPYDSIKWLKSIGVPDEKIGSTFDDALFYEVHDQDKVHNALTSAGIEPESPYLAVHVHGWGLAQEKTKKLAKQLSAALDRIRAESDLKICFVPMVKSDEKTISLVADGMEEDFHIVKSGRDIDVTIGTIRSAELCISMKHHPLIFAMGGAVPAIALAMENDDYYLHKNKGALEIFNQQDLLIRCALEEVNDMLYSKVMDTLKIRKERSCQIEERLRILESRKGETIKLWIERFKNEQVQT
ncbi:MAG: polysaccharide pyruvyl transferase family protein, partial [bacterium]